MIWQPLTHLAGMLHQDKCLNAGVVVTPCGMIVQTAQPVKACKWQSYCPLALTLQLAAWPHSKADFAVL